MSYPASSKAFSLKPLPLLERESVFRCICRSFLSAQFVSLVKEFVDANKADDLNFAVSLKSFKDWRPAQYSSWPEEKQAMLLGPPLFYKQYLSCHLGNIEFRGSDGRACAYNSGCRLIVDGQHHYGSIDNFIVVRLWDHSDAPETCFAVVRWGQTISKPPTESLQKVYLNPQSAECRKFAKEYSIVPLMCLSLINISFATLPPAIGGFTAQDKKEIMVIIHK